MWQCARWLTWDPFLNGFLDWSSHHWSISTNPRFILFDRILFFSYELCLLGQWMKWNDVLPWKLKIHNRFNVMTLNAYWTCLGAEQQHWNQGTRSRKTNSRSVCPAGTHMPGTNRLTLTSSITSHKSCVYLEHHLPFMVTPLVWPHSVLYKHCVMDTFNRQLDLVSLTLSLWGSHYSKPTFFLIFCFFDSILFIRKCKDSDHLENDFLLGVNLNQLAMD
jgi:hypothetical protein